MLNFKALILIFLGLIFLSIIGVIYLSYDRIIFYAYNEQLKFYRDITQQITNLKAQGSIASYTIILISFLYGIFHAIGPGHGKFIVTTYLILQPSQLKSSIIAVIIGSLLQALSAILLVYITLWVFKISVQQINPLATGLIKFSYMVVISFGVFLLIKGAKEVAKKFYNKSAKDGCKNVPLANAECAGGHKHVLVSEPVSSIKELFFLILSVGLRPCSGAILILILSFILQIYLSGIIAAFVMGVGTAITVISIAIFCVSCNKLAQTIFNKLLFNEDLNPKKTTRWQVFLSFIKSFKKIILFLLMGSLLVFIGSFLLISVPENLGALGLFKR